MFVYVSSFLLGVFFLMGVEAIAVLVIAFLEFRKGEDDE